MGYRIVLYWGPCYFLPHYRFTQEKQITSPITCRRLSYIQRDPHAFQNDSSDSEAWTKDWGWASIRKGALCWVWRVSRSTFAQSWNWWRTVPIYGYSNDLTRSTHIGNITYKKVCSIVSFLRRNHKKCSPVGGMHIYLSYDQSLNMKPLCGKGRFLTVTENRLALYSPF